MRVRAHTVPRPEHGVKSSRECVPGASAHLTGGGLTPYMVLCPPNTRIPHVPRIPRAAAGFLPSPIIPHSASPLRPAPVGRPSVGGANDNRRRSPARHFAPATVHPWPRPNRRLDTAEPLRIQHLDIRDTCTARTQTPKRIRLDTIYGLMSPAYPVVPSSRHCEAPRNPYPSPLGYLPPDVGSQ